MKVEEDEGRGKGCSLLRAKKGDLAGLTKLFLALEER